MYDPLVRLARHMLSGDHPRFAGPPATARAAVSNGTRILNGVDGRSAIARRYRDLVAALADELGGEAGLNEPQRIMVRQAAGLAVQAETLQATIVNGEGVDLEELVRVGNVLTRALKMLGIRSRARDSEPDLAAYLASKPGGGP